MKRFLPQLIWGLVLALGGLQMTYAQEIREASLAKIKGRVLVKMTNSNWRPASAGMILREKDEIRIGQDGFAEVLIDKGGSTGRLKISEKSHLRFGTLGFDSQTGGKITLLELAIGKVLVYTADLQEDSKFEVKTPTATAGAKGAIFEVKVEEVTTKTLS